MQGEQLTSGIIQLVITGLGTLIIMVLCVRVILKVMRNGAEGADLEESGGLEESDANRNTR
jgi:hypothetical protein